MTVKDFVEKARRIDEFEVFGDEFFEFYKGHQEEQLISEHGNEEISTIEFSSEFLDGYGGAVLTATIYLA